MRTPPSREIAELVGSRHDNVRVTIERLAKQGVITLPATQEVSNTGPGPKIITAYMVGKRDSYVIVAQLSPEFTARLVDRWEELELKVRQPVAPQSPEDLLAQAVLIANDRINLLAHKVHAQAQFVKAIRANYEETETLQEFARRGGTKCRATPSP